MVEKFSKKDFIVVIHNVRSCYNVGSVFRSADAFAVGKIFLGGYTPDPSSNRAVGKTALGAEKTVPWEKTWQTYKLIEKLKNQGFEIVALEQAPKSIPLEKFRPKFPLALIVGNEVKGLSKTMLQKVDKAVEIAMMGKKESLNVSVAFGVAANHISSKCKVQSAKFKM